MTRFIKENETIILFAQGLVFMALGFAVWLQRRRSTRLRLTQSLNWLAGFAVADALAVWGHVFIPIQERYVREGVIDALLVVRGLLQIAAFFLLFQFGIRLLVDSRRAKLIWRAVSTAVVLIVILVATLQAVAHDWTPVQWEQSVEALGRIVLMVPAVAVAACGMWRQRRELSDAGFSGIRRFAAAMSVAIVVYGIVALPLVGGPFWDPTDVASDGDRLTGTAIQISVLRGIVGLALCVFAIRLLEIFNVEEKEQLEAIDRARAVAEERERFGRDLHDGTIQSLYAAGLHLESVSMRACGSIRDEVRQVIEGLNETIGGIREYISDLRHTESGPMLLAASLQDVARTFEATTGVSVHCTVGGLSESGELPSEVNHHLEQVLREALSNAARHGHAREIQVEIRFAPDELDLVIVDDGQGIPAEPRRSGEGLRNMQERARRLGGRAVIGRAGVTGTRVAVEIPLDFDAPEEIESPDQEAVR